MRRAFASLIPKSLNVLELFFRREFVEAWRRNGWLRHAPQYRRGGLPGVRWLTPAAGLVHVNRDILKSAYFHTSLAQFEGAGWRLHCDSRLPLP